MERTIPAVVFVIVLLIRLLSWLLLFFGKMSRTCRYHCLGTREGSSRSLTWSNPACRISCIAESESGESLALLKVKNFLHCWKGKRQISCFPKRKESPKLPKMKVQNLLNCWKGKWRISCIAQGRNLFQGWKISEESLASLKSKVRNLLHCWKWKWKISCFAEREESHTWW